jgi:hypothetical protein
MAWWWREGVVAFHGLVSNVDVEGAQAPLQRPTRTFIERASER